MNPPKNDKPEPSNPPSADREPAAAPDAAPDAKKPGMKYVFKIAPADPKRNSIDFEDVADK
ncbi:MAG: hypothetical protein IPK67_03515 [Planctomycetes bacterium]|jgi:hypothetical protein|nr:hypothetical protein [Planctomycetota bacterium]